MLIHEDNVGALFDIMNCTVCVQRNLMNTFKILHTKKYILSDKT